MLEKYIPKRFATAMIKHVIAVTLFFPYFYSHNNNPSYLDFVLSNFFAILAMVFICTSWKLDFKRNAIFAGSLGILLLTYNICATYMNVKYHHWYGEQINVTISFLFFIVLLLVKDIHALIDTATIKATIHMIVASNVLAICFRFFTEYNRIILINGWVQFEEYPETLHEQYAWFYGHKSEYGLMLVLCMALFVVYRKHFSNIFTYILSLGVLFIALFISDSYTAMGAALLIFVGQFLDYLRQLKHGKKIIIALVALPLPFLFIVSKLFSKLGENRDLLSLGARLPIWQKFTELIADNPNGIGMAFGNTLYLVPNVTWTNNCHNVFLNHMFRFSILVGGIFVVLCILVALFFIKKNFCFTTVCVYGTLLIPMMMDYALTTLELSYVLIIVFIISERKCFKKQ